MSEATTNQLVELTTPELYSAKYARILYRRLIEDIIIAAATVEIRPGVTESPSDITFQEGEDYIVDSFAFEVTLPSALLSLVDPKPSPEGAFRVSGYATMYTATFGPDDGPTDIVVSVVIPLAIGTLAIPPGGDKFEFVPTPTNAQLSALPGVQTSQT